MGVPATTGQLRTKILDMKIGDYIPCRYIATTSGTLGKISEIGVSNATEIPFNSSATPNGTFYFVKVATGLLVADRVCQHSISWATLNSNKAIQNLIWDSGNSIPIMTSNTTPSGVVRTNSENTSIYNAWKLFDGLITTTSYYSSNGATIGNPTVETPIWISYQFPSPKRIESYKLAFYSEDDSSSPKNWTFEGSNDNLNWTVLHENNSRILYGTEKRFFFKNFNHFLYYRINITSVVNSTYLRFKELEMFENVFLQRSISGGVAFADADGNKSLVDLGKGAFPTNNEWDSYIINFPTNKIINGNTINDVFHHLSVGTWVQETPITAIGANIDKVYRNGTQFSKIDALTVSSIIGYRPVFEYYEF